MNRDSGSRANERSSPKEAPDKGVRPRVVVVALLAGAVVFWSVLGGGVTRLKEESSRPSVEKGSLRTVEPETAKLPGSTVDAWRRSKRGSGGTALQDAGSASESTDPMPETARVPVISPDALGPATPESQTVLKQLTSINPAKGTLTPEQATKWKESLQTLIAQGAPAVAAIRDFLRSGSTVDFGAAGLRGVGYSTAREAMADVLARIGGPEALGVTLESLQGNRNPREVAMLSQALEAQAPEQQREAALAAARSVLALGKAGELEGKDVAPVFEILEKYGGPEAIPELEKSADQWKYYSTMALAQLPEGAGVPSLIRMLNESRGSDIPAIEALASISTRNPSALTALLDLAREGGIAPNAWPYLAQALDGSELQVADSVFDRVLTRSDGKELQTTHIPLGNQNFHRAPTVDTLTAEQIRQQIHLVEEFGGLAEANPAAIKALQQTRAILERRLASAVPPSTPSPAPAEPAP